MPHCVVNKMKKKHSYFVSICIENVYFLENGTDFKFENTNNYFALLHKLFF